MALHQNSTVTDSKLLIGNFAIGVATVLTVGTSVGTGLTGWSNLGAGIVTGFNHNVTKYDVQSGNAPDPIEGVADESVIITGELIEYDETTFASAFGGIVAASSDSTTTTILGGGGASTVTPKSFKLYNRRIISGVSVYTYIVVYKGTMTNGPQLTIKSDNDSDPIGVFAFEIEGKADESRTTGHQVYDIYKVIN